MTKSTPINTDNIDDKTAELIAACDRLIGVPLARLSFPGGRSRKTAIAHTEDGHTYGITRRRRKNRAELEYGVLNALHEQGAPVPKPITFDGEWLVQEYLGHVRLSKKLDDATDEDLQIWLDRAVTNLIQIHDAGRRAGLAQSVAVIGNKPGWLDTLVAMPGSVGAYFDMAPRNSMQTPSKRCFRFKTRNLSNGMPAPAMPSSGKMVTLAG
ncbi:MAG: RIO1 family regulatory kinase/ATPase domain-containing protein [Alphaproteobacteria bacterium]